MDCFSQCNENFSTCSQDLKVLSGIESLFLLRRLKNLKSAVQFLVKFQQMEYSIFLSCKFTRIRTLKLKDKCYEHGQTGNDSLTDMKRFQ